MSVFEQKYFTIVDNLRKQRDIMSSNQHNHSGTEVPFDHFDPAVMQIYKVLQVAKRTGADPEVTEGLQTALQYVRMRDDYTLKCTSAESDACRQVATLTQSLDWDDLKKEGKTLFGLETRMLTGASEGQFLKSFLSAQRARRVLDVGTFTGYSALAMAEALPEDGVVVTLDRDPFLERLNMETFAACPQGSKIQIRTGPALETVRKMVTAGEKFDFIFIDATKSEYVDYVKIAFDEGLLAENGTVVADNAYRDGAGYLPSKGTPDAARVFGEFVANNANLHKVLVPVRDGVLVLRRLNEVERDLPAVKNGEGN
ncbi:hypothetical protein BaRGS_00020639 [Batillaria attramentaria]|uniref:O-methyltransferase n=1 Tax=Batillaria attramentaria TaxID=370345 RepID=A0ABD0KLD5_9CAEN